MKFDEISITNSFVIATVTVILQKTQADYFESEANEAWAWPCVEHWYTIFSTNLTEFIELNWNLNLIESK